MKKSSQKKTERMRIAQETLEKIASVDAGDAANAESVVAVTKLVNLDFINYLNTKTYSLKDPDSLLTYYLGSAFFINKNEKESGFSFSIQSFSEHESNGKKQIKVKNTFKCSYYSNINIDLIKSIFTIINSISNKASTNFLLGLIFMEKEKQEELMTIANIDYVNIPYLGVVRTIERQQSDKINLAFSEEDPRERKLKIYKSKKVHYYNNEFGFLKIPDDWVFIPKGNRAMSIAINKFPCWKLQKKRVYQVHETCKLTGNFYPNSKVGYNTAGYFISAENLKAALDMSISNARDRSLASFRREFRNNYAYSKIDNEKTENQKEILRQLEISMSK